jgi:hypothetical protein
VSDIIYGLLGIIAMWFLLHGEPSVIDLVHAKTIAYLQVKP